MPLLGEMWASMALTGKAVIVILSLLSTYSMGLVVERLLALRWARERTDAFRRDCEGITDAAALRARAEAAEFADYTSLAVVVSEGLDELDRARTEDGVANGDVVAESVREAMRRGLDMAAVNLRAHLTSLATVSGVAPFLGLFGTVTGLISAFRGIAETGGGGLAAVSSGVSEALVTTVVGLFVAMPALWAYNYFSQRVEVLVVHIDNAAHGLLGGVVRGAVKLTGEGASGSRRERRAAEGVKVSALPDITPIVNVALVLLIIFMIVTPMIREGVQVNTPKAQTVEQLQESSQAVIVAVQDDGALFVNLKPVDLGSLQSELSLAYVGQEGKPVVIKGAENLPYSEILELMDVCKKVGAPSVDLVAERVD